MNISENSFINGTFSFFILVMIYLNYKKLLKTTLDLYLSRLAILISVMLLAFKHDAIIDLGHFLYCSVYLFFVAVFSNNQYLLALNIIMILTIIYSRYYYKDCILNIKQNNTGFFWNLNNSKETHLWFWDWDYIFPILLLVSSIRFIRIRGATL